jgi:hypothetical protein
MSDVINFTEARQRLRPPPQYLRDVFELSLEERQHSDQLPYVSGLPTAFLEGRWP